MELNGTVAIITGSTGQLGQAIAKALAQAGCNCICHYKSDSGKAGRLVEQIRRMGVKATALKADLAEAGQIEDLFQKAGQFGTAQVLINSAAVFSRQPLAEVTFEQAQRILALNLIAPILACREFAKKVKAEFAGATSAIAKIINIADVGAIEPWAEYVLYCSSKAGLIGATKALAKELAPAICVNAVAVGLAGWPSNFDRSQKQRQISFIPLGRIAEPVEVAEAIIFLLKNDYITGQVLNVDGGRCI